MISPAWIAVDWGTTNLRLWALGPDGEVLIERSSDQGMGVLGADEFEPALLALCNDLIDGPTDVVICGMAGARQGWVDAGYAPVPTKPSGLPGVMVQTSDPRLRVTILPGVSQASPPDVMRGEETQIAGFLADNPAFDGVICLPGTHTKWVHVSAEEIVSFRTFMTGELFALLSRQSILRHGISDGWDAETFQLAVGDAMSKPEMLGASLFSLRGANLLEGLQGHIAGSRLSGLLIGMELAGARPYWLGQRVVLIGASTLCDRYSAALNAQAVPTERVDAAALTLAGLRAAHKHQTGASS